MKWRALVIVGVLAVTGCSSPANDRPEPANTSATAQGGPSGVQTGDDDISGPQTVPAGLTEMYGKFGRPAPTDNPDVSDPNLDQWCLSVVAGLDGGWPKWAGQADTSTESDFGKMVSCEQRDRQPEYRLEFVPAKSGEPAGLGVVTDTRMEGVTPSGVKVTVRYDKYHEAAGFPPGFEQTFESWLRATPVRP